MDSENPNIFNHGIDRGVEKQLRRFGRRVAEAFASPHSPWLFCRGVSARGSAPGRPFCESGGAQRRHRASVDRLDHGLPGPRPYMDKLAKAQAKSEHKRPTLEIEPHDSAYYQDDAPKISDAEYDAPRLRFNAIEARFPEFVSVLDFRFAAHCGLKSDIAPCRESATGLNRSRGRVRGKRHGRASNGWKPWSVLPDDEGPEARPQNRRSSA